MGIPIFDVDRRIAQLKSDATLQAAMGGTVKLHADVAPEEQSQGFWIVTNLMSGRNTNTMDGHVTFARPTYAIAVYVRDLGYLALQPACERIIEILTTGPTEVNSTYVGKFVHTLSFRDIDVVKGMRLFSFTMVFDIVAYDT